MYIQHNSHLSYCTNIHPGETWEQTFQSLKDYTTKVRDKIGNGKPFGLGLRLSNKASIEIFEGDAIQQFKDWLAQENIYVFTMNGFPYHDFHDVVIKDKVHLPDWSTQDRVDYTKRLFDLLSAILPKGMEGGISTSPLSYKYWHNGDKEINELKQEACTNLAEIVCHLATIKEKTGQILHLDIEPEPDGVIETSTEFVDYYKEYFLKSGVELVMETLGYSHEEAKASMIEHIQLCYDICHFAVGYEDSETVVSRMAENGIKIGKIQISAALKAAWNSTNVDSVKENLKTFDELTYLHQTVIKKTNGSIENHQDLGTALEVMSDSENVELRTHFHVPVFVDEFYLLKSTQSDVVELLNLWNDKPFTQHLEVETYTWDVLPPELKVDVVDSICRELNWVSKIIEQ